MNRRDYYVYVYIDPRNLEEFYYGKGKGSRRYAHLSDTSDSEKAVRIRAIHEAGEIPIIRTVAASLTEEEAHLIETTLIWKLGNGLTNRVAGKYSSKFRPHHTLHRELPGFDYQNGIYYVNVGDGPNRKWEDCRRLGFMSAGQGPEWRDQILELSEGDVVAAYLTGHGFVGVGKVTSRAVPFNSYLHEGKLLTQCDLIAERMWQNAEDPDKSEYVARVQWKKTVTRENARWKKKSGLYTTQLIRATLERQPITINFLQEEFGVDLGRMAA